MGSLTIIGRATWGAGPLRSGAKIDHARFVGLAIHHTVMVMPDYDRDGIRRGDIDDVKRYMRQLQTARPDLGNEVPYSWVVFPGRSPDDGVVAEGRGFGVTGAHTVGYNSTRYGVAYAGNTNTDPVTPGVLEAIRWVGRHLADPAGAARTFGHRDVKSTACPGDRLYNLLDRIQPPFATEEDDMEVTELRDELKGGPSRQHLKTLVQGALLDGIRKRSDTHPDRGDLREPFKELLREVLAENPPAPPG